MRRGHPIWRKLWEFVIAAAVVGPLGSAFYDELRQAQTLSSLYNFARSNQILSFAGATLGIVLFYGLTRLAFPNERASAKVARHELPPLRPEFTNRDRETKELVEAVRKHHFSTLAVRGMAGIGKTTLAIKVAETLAPYFPDGEIYVDLKRGPKTDEFPRGRPLTVAEVMDKVIHSLDLEAPVPPNDAARVGDYYNALFGKRVVLLMDNAEDAAQVKDLAPQKGSVMIVTSRERFDLPGLARQDLDKFSREDACKLLLKVAPSIGDRADEIASLCEFLPEALSRVGGMLVSQSLSSLLKKMENIKERSRITGIELSLTASSEMLTDDLRQRWFQLGIFPDTFDGKAAAKVWDVELDDAKDVLEDLRKRCLVELHAELTKRYKLTNLVRDFTFSHLDNIPREAARRRHSGYYRRVLQFADHLCLTEKEAEGLALFDLEWSNLNTGQAWAASNAGVDLAASELVIGYAYVGKQSLFLRKRPREFLEWLRMALAISRQKGNRQNEGVMLQALGRAYELMMDYERSIEYFKQDLAVARQRGARDLEGDAFLNLAVVSNKAGRLNDATSYAKHALESFEAADISYPADVLNRLDEWRRERDQSTARPISFSVPKPAS